MLTPNRRTAFLEEMGLGPVWLRRDPPAAVEQLAEAAPAGADAVAESAVPVVPSAWSDEMPVHQVVSAAELPELVPASVPHANDVANLDWRQLKDAVAGCEKCGLCRGRTNTVFGVGDEKARWMFIGEGPGRNEDLRGEPFVGQAGKLLDNMLLAMGLKRGENAYIANIVKCRATDATGKDRPPTPEESAACMPYLMRQIELIQPTMLIALGKTAALSLLALDPDTPVSKLRGTVHQYAGRPLVVTYHPAYLLRNMADKRKAWADLCLAMKTYADAE